MRKMLHMEGLLPQKILLSVVKRVEGLGVRKLLDKNTRFCHERELEIRA